MNDYDELINARKLRVLKIISRFLIAWFIVSIFLLFFGVIIQLYYFLHNAAIKSTFAVVCEWFIFPLIKSVINIGFIAICIFLIECHISHSERVDELERKSIEKYHKNIGDAFERETTHVIGMDTVTAQKGKIEDTSVIFVDSEIGSQSVGFVCPYCSEKNKCYYLYCRKCQRKIEYKKSTQLQETIKK